LVRRKYGEIRMSKKLDWNKLNDRERKKLMKTTKKFIDVYNELNFITDESNMSDGEIK